jgi:hypothetical protein
VATTTLTSGADLHAPRRAVDLEDLAAAAFDGLLVAYDDTLDQRLEELALRGDGGRK